MIRFLKQMENIVRKLIFIEPFTLSVAVKTEQQHMDAISQQNCNKI